MAFDLKINYTRIYFGYKYIDNLDTKYFNLMPLHMKKP